MAVPAITVESVSKRYVLGETRSTTMVERMSSVARAPSRLLSRGGAGKERAEPEEFWALRDVSLEVATGSVVGLIGANGAGKSTLLKLLARVTPPSEGRIVLNGRVGSLLEVGTGFHPELTGRENTYLSGAILGMRRREVAWKFDSIVGFAGVEDFVDTPVKRYSSGMYVRLAFAVAAFLEPEILLVDEVLAVGDAEFQRRCLGRMREVVDKGRTIVFVSHNLSAVQRLCEQSVWLEHGRVAAAGPTADVVGSYLHQAGARQDGGRAVLGPNVTRIGTGTVKLTRASLLGAESKPVERVALGEPLAVEMMFDAGEPIDDAVVELGITSADGVRVATAQSIDADGSLIEIEPGTTTVRAELDLTLMPGEFHLDIAIHRLAGLTLDLVERVISFTALNTAHDGSHPYPWNVVRGAVRPASRWATSDLIPAGAGERSDLEPE
jgi:lipopolysaccharide transport system ATP-binding protein